MTTFYSDDWHDNDDSLPEEDWRSSLHEIHLYESNQQDDLIADIVLAVQTLASQRVRDCYINLYSKTIIVRVEDYRSRIVEQLRDVEVYELHDADVAVEMQHPMVIRNSQEYYSSQLQELFSHKSADEFQHSGELNAFRQMYAPNTSHEVLLERYIDELTEKPSPVQIENIFSQLLAAGQFPAIPRLARSHLMDQGFSREDISTMYNHEHYQHLRSIHRFVHAIDNHYVNPWKIENLRQLDVLLPSEHARRSYALQHYINCLKPDGLTKNQKGILAILSEREHDFEIRKLAEELLNKAAS